MPHDWRFQSVDEMQRYTFKCRNCFNILETFDPDPDPDRHVNGKTCELLVAEGVHAS